MKNLDETDVKILNRPETKRAYSAERAVCGGISDNSAVSARIEKLEAGRVYKGYHADLDLEKLGYGIRAFIMITVQPEDSGKFYDFCQKREVCPGMQSHYRPVLDDSESRIFILQGFWTYFWESCRFSERRKHRWSFSTVLRDIESATGAAKRRSALHRLLTALRSKRTENLFKGLPVSFILSHGKYRLSMFTHVSKRSALRSYSVRRPEEPSPHIDSGAPGVLV